MAAGNRDGKFHFQKFSQHFRPRNHRNIFAMRLNNFRIIRFNRRRNHRHIGAADIFRCMSARHLHAQPLQTKRRIGDLGIRTADAVTKIKEHFGDAAHADATNADKMDALDFALHESCFLIFSHLLTSFLCAPLTLFLRR